MPDVSVLVLSNARLASARQALVLRDLRLYNSPLPDGLGPALRVLALYGCGLEEVPPAVCELGQLETLHLSNNKLTDLPREIVQLINLQSMGLSDNRFTMIPVILGRLPCFAHLWMHDNPLCPAQQALYDEFESGRDCDRLLVYLHEASALEALLLCGLQQEQGHWSRFLSQGLYDPRLFKYHIGPFIARGNQETV